MYISRNVQFNEVAFPFSQHIHASLSNSSHTLNSSLTVLPLLPSTVPHTVTTPPASAPAPLTASPTAVTTVAASSPISLPIPSTTAHIAPSSVPHTAPSTRSTSTTHQMLTRTKTSTLKPKRFPGHHLYQVTNSSLQPTDPDPTCFTRAVKSDKWRMAMAQELGALAHNNTWSLVPPPTDANIIGCKWIFKTKKNSDGTMARYKARLVAKGYTQEEGFDYFEIFSPVVKPTTIRTVLTLALSNN